MKYAIQYYSGFRHYDDIDEVIFSYTGEGNLEYINNIIKKQEQKVILCLTGTFDINAIIININIFKTSHPNVLVQIDFFDEKRDEYIQLLKDNNIPFMFHTFAKNFSTVCAMRLLGAEDIYIVEDICFSLDLLQKMREGGVRFRVLPNIAQSPKGTGTALPQVTKFWIRPEDTEVYEKYIDVMEFTGPPDRASVVYEVYSKRQWLGKIKDIILDYQSELENTSIAPHFGPMRTHCHKKCTYGNCNICTEIEKLGFNFAEAEIALVKKKYKPEVDKEIINEQIDKLKERGKELLNGSKFNETAMQSENS